MIVHTIMQTWSKGGYPAPATYSQETAEQIVGERSVLHRLVDQYERDFPKKLRWDAVSGHGMIGEIQLGSGRMRFSVLITPVEPDSTGEFEL
ncbi:hypothetical protein [Rhodococcus opacus]|uniref:hypothetical protein n=1 Tax=Rhodococcus opacus TaxID=37919 RepID=UPI002235CF30|nr:hypothetical protein [Rhodococcus opacus]UZG56246.1 hypothetical protein ONE62_02675 [Rhodococcus opacus]